MNKSLYNSSVEIDLRLSSQLMI